MSLNFDNFRPSPEGFKPVDPFANKRKALKPLRKNPSPPPDSIFNQRIDPTDFKKVNIEKAKRQFVPQYKRKKNAAQDASLKVANETFGQPLQEVATAISNKAQKDPVFTQTFQKQQTPGTKEAALKEYDMHRFGFTTSGDAQYNDFDRRNFADAIDKHLKDGHIDPGKWAQMMDTLKGKTGRQVLGLGPGLRENPESNFGDEATTAVAESIKASSQVPGQLLASPIEGIADEALPDGPGKNFVKGVAPLLGMVATGPLGVMAGNAQLIGSAISGEASKQITDTADTIKTIGDTNADPGTRWAGAVNLAVMAWGLIHGTKTMAKISKGPKFNPSDPIQAKAVLDEVESTHGPEAKSEVAQAMAEAPELFDTQKFTEGLKAQEGPLEFGQGPKFTVKAKALGKESTPAASTNLPIEPIVDQLQPAKDVPYPQETVPNEKTVETSQRNEGARRLGDEAQGEIGRGERQGNDTKIPPVDETVVQKKDVTGLANQVNEREALDGIISEVEKTKGGSKSHWQEEGRKAVEDGADYEGLADRVGSGQEELTGLKTGILLEGKRRLLNEVNKARESVDSSPTVENRQRYDDAQSRLDTYLQNVQAGKGRWSDVGRALQAGTSLDTGNFAEVLAEAKRKPHYDPKQEAKIAELTSEVAKRDAEIERLKANPSEYDAKQAVSRVSARRFNKNQIRSNIETNRTKLRELVGSGGVTGPRTRGAASKITAEDLKVAKDQAMLIKEIALDHVRLGLANLEDVVIAVQKMLKDDGIDIERQAVIDAIATPGESKPRTEAQKRLDDLRTESKRLSSETSEKLQKKAEADAIENAAKTKVKEFKEGEKKKLRISKKQMDFNEHSDFKEAKQAFENAQKQEIASRKELQAAHDKIERMKASEEKDILRKWWNNEAAIIDAKEQLSTGNIVQKPKRVRTVTEEIADLEAQRKVWDSRVKAKLREMETPMALRVVRKATGFIRMSRLGRDLGMAFRQGLFTVSRPKAVLKGAKSGARVAFSETELAKWGTELENKRYSDGKSALRIRKEAGLSLTDAINTHEENFMAALAEKIPAMGFLERAQTAGINTARAEMFDSFYEKGATMDELKSRARYINSVTGRGNAKNVPSDLENVLLTSTRFERSRWETIYEPVRNIASIGNKGSRANLQDLAVTAATVVVFCKTAELAGYKFNWQKPDEPDFLKLRKGDEVWDVTAGIAPRVRDAIAVMGAIFNKPGYRDNIRESLGKAVTRTISPGVTTPVYMVSKETQKHKRVPKPKNPVSGYEFEGHEGDLIGAFITIGEEGAIERYQKKHDIPEAVVTYLKEFVGTSVNFYKPSKSPSFKRKRS